MRTETQGPIKHILKWTENRRSTARAALMKSESQHDKIMLAAKIKAYTNVISHINDRYGRKLEE